MLALLLLAHLSGALATVANLTLLPLSTGAAALDGSPYGFYFVPNSGSRRWTISIEGGGWCVGVDECFERSQQRTHDGKPGSLGSSIPYIGQQHGCDCMNTNGTAGVDPHGCNCLLLLYLDGASFSGNRRDPVPVPGHPGKFLHYKGLSNLDATLDYAFAHLGLGRATEMVVTGGSAGGLSTFLHADRIARRLRQQAPECKRTTAAPVVGYFLDHAKYSEVLPPNHHLPQAQAIPAHALPPLRYPDTGNYSSWMKIVFTDQNITEALHPACLAAFPRAPHLCFMSPHMARFVQTPFFMFNSKFDAWQMDNDLQVPCKAGEAKHARCSAAEQAAIVQYGDDFLTALHPVVTSAPKNGAFITSCVCHGCPWATLTTGTRGDAKTAYMHYAEWYAGRTRGDGAGDGASDGATIHIGSRPPKLRDGGATIHIDTRPPNGGGQLHDKMCVPFP